MSAAPFVKKYPRALIKRHQNANGWTIDLIQRAGVKPKRVAATYASIPWATRAARQKLGLPVAAVQAAHRPTLPTPAELSQGLEQLKRPVPPKPKKDAGHCNQCNRAMRPAGTKTADYPDTVLRQRAGLCQSCHNSNNRAAR
ncbi:hypothetical protein [Paenarthrobacter ilicis]|uniref:hypothetical protein n=1 Tax=Paenarthrobacter ilicis TaxID=43665 RepID=UPI0028D5FE05|nr:hypothetical protein [Paenarthrobacter ilicis]